MDSGMPRSRSTSMKGAHWAITSLATARCRPFPKSALLDQVDLAHPAEHSRVFAVEELDGRDDRPGARKVGKGHRQGHVNTRRGTGQHAGRVGEVVLEGGEDGGSRAVEVVGAGRVHREHLADAVDVHEADARLAQVAHDLVEGYGGAAEGAEVEVRVDDGGLGLGGAVVADRIERWQERGQGGWGGGRAGGGEEAECGGWDSAGQGG